MTSWQDKSRFIKQHPYYSSILKLWHGDLMKATVQTTNRIFTVVFKEYYQTVAKPQIDYGIKNRAFDKANLNYPSTCRLV